MGERSRCSVAVLFGGASAEREVSIDTGRCVLGALEEARRAGLGPTSVLAVEWEADGAWSFDGTRYESRDEALAALRVDVVFLGLHGGEGENGVVQRALEAAGLAYTGSGPDASRLAMDKLAARERAVAAGLAVAPAVCLAPDEWTRGERTDELRRFYDRGMIVKPRHGGSSVDTRIVQSAAELAEALEPVFASGEEALVEELLDGVEVTCGVLGNADETPRALTPVEIRPHEGRFFDYEEKYSAGGADELCPPERLDAEGVRRLRNAAVTAHRMLGCDGYSRSDFFETERGLVFLETNTLPGFTERSLMPQAAAADGLGFPELCCWILDAARRREAGRNVDAGGASA